MAKIVEQLAIKVSVQVVGGWIRKWPRLAKALGIQLGIPVTPVAVVLLQDEHGHYLMGKRNAQGSWVHDLWEFPGGKVEPYESLHVAARREMREELGVGVLLGRLLPMTLPYVNEGTGKCGLLIAVTGTILNGEPTSVDGSHLELRWFTPEEAHEAHERGELMPNSIEFLRMAQHNG